MFGIISPREVFYVSVVIGICGNNFCALISDGRKIDPIAVTPKILDEDFPKVFKVNNKLLFSGTGIYRNDENILDPLRKFSVKRNISVQMAHKATVKYLEKQKNNFWLTRNYIIGGKNTNGNFELHEIHFDLEKHEVNTIVRKPTKGFAISVGLPPALNIVQDKILQTVGEFIRVSKTYEQMIKYVQDFVRELYVLDNTIGGTVFTESIT